MTAHAATLRVVRPVVRKPSAETMELARALVDDPAAELRSADAELEAAAREVAQTLDDYERRLIARRAGSPAGDPARAALEAAIARRIASTRLARGASPRAPMRLVVRVADASEPMTWPLDAPDTSMAGLEPARTKANAVEMTTRDLVCQLADSRQAANVLYASVSFNDRVTELLTPRPVTDVAATESFDPTDRGVGGTRIWLGLEAAAALVAEYRRRQARAVSLSTLVLLAAGTRCENAERTRAAAARVRALPDTHLAACLYATAGERDADTALLSSLVSDERLFQVVENAEDLRRFVLESVAAVAPRVAPPT